MCRNQQNLYPRCPTAVARLLQYSGLGSNTGMGFLREMRSAVKFKNGEFNLDLGF